MKAPKQNKSKGNVVSTYMNIQGTSEQLKWAFLKQNINVPFKSHETLRQILFTLSNPRRKILSTPFNTSGVMVRRTKIILETKLLKQSVTLRPDSWNASFKISSYTNNLSPNIYPKNVKILNHEPLGLNVGLPASAE